MTTSKDLFHQYLAQTSPFPLGLNVVKGDGIYLFDDEGKSYMDLISGVCVNNLGHNNPSIKDAIRKQLDKHLHLMVYGEFIQEAQVNYAKLLADNLPDNLNCTYFVNSGSEAVEGALKLAKRATNRTEIVAFKNSYHGSTHGSLSVMGEERYKNAYRPLLPDVRFLEFNNQAELTYITTSTACVIIEPVQGEAGIISAEKEFLKKLRIICNRTGALLIFDEVQTGFGRTGSLFAFQKYDVIPDVLVLAKAIGGGMPLGAFISSNEIMNTLKTDPVLGHITTFGGNPICCAAGMATLNILLNGDVIAQIPLKEKLFLSLLKHPQIKYIRSKGLMIAVEFDNADICNKTIKQCLKNGAIVDSFLHAPHCLRISPPLIITNEQIVNSCEIIVNSIE